MMKKVLFVALLIFSAMPMFADTEVNTNTNSDKNTSKFAPDVTTEFGNEETVTYGITNHLIEKLTKTDANANQNAQKTEGEKMSFGAKVTKFVSVPKFGGYFIGKYAWNSDDAQDAKSGFSQRLIRVYVDGTILKDFTYRIQFQINNASSHIKDYFVEWGHFKEAKLKIGQYKRAFTFENPMNPWDVGVGDYSQLVKKLAGMGDRNGEANMGGRDQGLQLQGDLFPIGKDGHRLIHYQAMIANGQGINVSDANKHKDFIGTIQVQPIKNLFVGFFGWTGNYTSGNITVDRKRWVVSAKYSYKDWVFRTEYGRSKGYKIGDYDSDGELMTKDKLGHEITDKADAFYATVGIPVVSWFNVYLKYDTYRDYGTSESRKTIYSIAPAFRLHKNLMFQLQYNYNDDKFNSSKYSEIWVQTYVRF